MITPRIEIVINTNWVSNPDAEARKYALASPDTVKPLRLLDKQHEPDCVCIRYTFEARTITSPSAQDTSAPRSGSSDGFALTDRA